MARSIGSIEITVDANTGRLVAQLTAAGKRAGRNFKMAAEKEMHDLQAVIDLETAEATTEARILRQRIEAQMRGIPIDFDVDTAETVARIQELKAEAEAFDIVLNAVIHGELSAEDMANAVADWKSVAETIEADKLHVELEVLFMKAEAETEAFMRAQELQTMEFEATVEMIFTEARAQREAFDRQQRLNRVGLETEMDFTRAEAEILGFQASHANESVRLNLELEANRRQLAFQMAAIEAMVGAADLDATVNVEPKVDRAAKAATDAEIFTNFQGLGAKSGDAFLDSMSTRLKLIAGAVVLLAEPIGVALEGALAAVTAVTSSAFSGLAGGLGAITPLVAGLVPLFSAGAVGAIGLGDAMGAISDEFATAVHEGRAFRMETEAIHEAMSGLGPEARNFVTAFSEIFPAIEQLQRSVSDRLFAGLDDTLRGLASTVLPDIQGALSLAGDSLNTFFKGLADVAIDIDFTRMFAGMQPAMDSLLSAVTSIFGALEPFFHAAAPAAQALAENIAQAAEAFAKMVSAGDESGGLATFFMEGVRSLEIWWELIRNVGDALFTLFEAGKTSGDSMVQSLADIVAKFDEWMESAEGQTALAEFFDTATSLASALVPILEGLQGFFDNLVTDGAVDRMVDFGRAIGDFLPSLGSFFELIGRTGVLQAFADLFVLVGDAVTLVLPQLQEFADVLGIAFAEAVASVADVMPQLAQSFADLSSALATPIADVITFIGDALGLLGDVLAPLVSLVSQIPTPVLTMVAAFVAFHGVGSRVVQAAAGVAQAFVNMKSVVSGGLGSMLANANVWAAGITIAITGAVLAWQHFTAEQREVEARTREVAGALDEQVDSLLDTVDATNAARLGYDALSATLAATGEDGEKLSKALGTVGLTIGDSLDTLVSFGDTSEEAHLALVALARSAGLTGPAVGELAKIVNSIDGSIVHAAVESDTLTSSFGDLAAATGVPREQLFAIAEAMEEIQHQAAKNDLNQMVRDFLAVSAAGSETNQTLLEQAERFTKTKRTGDDVLDLYARYTFLLGKNKVELDEAAEAERKRIDAQIAGVDATDDATAALERERQALRQIAKEMAAWTVKITKANDAIDDMTEAFDQIGVKQDALSAMFDLGNRPLEVAGQVRDIELAIDDLSETAKDVKVGDILAGNIAADDVLDALDDLRPEIQQQITDAFSTGGPEAAVKLAEEYTAKVAEELGISKIDAAKLIGIDEMKAKVAVAFELTQKDQARRQLEALVELTEETPLTASLALGLDEGSISPEQVFAVVQPMLEAAGVTIPPGLKFPPNAEVEQMVKDMMAGVTAEVPLAPEPLTGQQLLDLVNAGLAAVNIPPIELPMVPESAVETEPLINAELLKLNLNEITAPVGFPPPADLQGALDTVMAGVVPASIKFPQFTDPAQLEGFAAQFPPVDVSVTLTDAASATIDDIAVGLDGLDTKTADPEVTLTDAATQAIADIQADIDFLATSTAKPVVDPDADTAATELSGLQTQLDTLDGTTATPAVDVETAATLTEVAAVQTAINNLRSKTITITVNRVGGSLPPGAGDLEETENMAGGMINFPTISRLGERGYREAVIPMQLPLNRIDPSVRHLAELIRGGGNTVNLPAGRTVNNYLTVNPAAADPSAVAVQVLNRAASLANR